MPRTQNLLRPSSHTYDRDSVERALDLHIGQGNSKGWTSNGNGGYLIPTGIGIVELRTLREAALFAIASAEKGRRTAAVAA